MSAFSGNVSFEKEIEGKGKEKGKWYLRGGILLSRNKLYTDGLHSEGKKSCFLAVEHSGHCPDKEYCSKGKNDYWESYSKFIHAKQTGGNGYKPIGKGWFVEAVLVIIVDVQKIPLFCHFPNTFSIQAFIFCPNAIYTEVYNIEKPCKREYYPENRHSLNKIIHSICFQDVMGDYLKRR